jgi:prophage antirepressor-like protein
MEQMQIYEHEQFGKIRTLTKDGDIWFVATDICDALDIAKTQAEAVTASG